jgi:hypothetical protein
VTRPAMIEVVRDVVDIGIRVVVSVPATWSEVAVEGALLVVGGPLENHEQTLVPTLQLRVREVNDVSEAESVVFSPIDVLSDAEILYQWSGVDADGRQECISELAHRSGVTGATQISMFRSIRLSTNQLALNALATCGGGASQEARDILRGVVTSISVAVGPQVAVVKRR